MIVWAFHPIIAEDVAGEAAINSSFTSRTIFIRFSILSSILGLIGWLENHTGDEGSEDFSGSK